MPDAPRRLPPSPQQRANTQASRMNPGSMAGGSLSVKPVPASSAASSRALNTPPTGFVPIADATGTVSSDTNPGFPGSPQISVVTLPADAPAIAIKLAGDTYPRLVVMADSADGIYLGNGTDDFSTTFVNLSMDSGGKLTVGVAGSAPGVQFSGGDVIVQSSDVRFPATGSGPVVTDTVTGTHYRLTVASGVVTPVVA